MGTTQPKKLTMGEMRQMETFADKVRFGGGLRFDPLLKERGGGIAGEDPKRDEVMTEAVIEVLAKVS